MIDLDAIFAPVGRVPKLGQAYSSTFYKSRNPAPAHTPDFARIKALPKRPIPESGTSRGEALIALANETYGRVNEDCDCAALGRECIRSVNLTQAWALHELRTQQGLLGAVGVGHGKTLLDILAPLAIHDCKIALLLVPTNLVQQLAHEHRLLSQHFETPSLAIHKAGGGGTAIEGTSSRDTHVHVLPYSMLQRPAATGIIEYIKPDFIIADECHKLRNPDTATTARFLRYCAEHGATRFAGWSGTLTDKSIKDYAHLSGLALKQRSPLPLDGQVVASWACAIDASDNPAEPGVLVDFCKPGDFVRAGFYSRLTETPGVVSTSVAAVACDLEFVNRSPETPSIILEALRKVRDTKKRPDGEEFIDTFSLTRCGLELAAGFYYRWWFPRGESVALIDEWRLRRGNWRRELREKLEAREEHLDSPYLCAVAAQRAYGQRDNREGKPVWKAQDWLAWSAIKDKVKPETEAVRVHDYLAQDAAAWALENRGLVWYWQAEFGRWVAEISGLPLHGGGPDAGERIYAEKGDRSLIVSAKSHGTGRDGLQRLFDRQLVGNPPSSATDWEQMLGRLIRVGQKSDRVVTEIYQHTAELRDNLSEARSRAVYVSDTIGAKQKLNG